MKKIFVLLSVIWFTQIAVSQQVSFKEAQTVAQNFFSKQHKSLVNCVYVSKNQNDTLFYIFNATDGFVVIAADKRSLPVLAFSDKGSFDKQEIIAPVRMWLENYELQLKQLKSDNQAMPMQQSWNRMLKNKKDFDNNVAFVAPLLTSKWGQGSPYNYYCPKDENGTNGRAVTGCVATAMAQIMYYFRFPESGTDSYSYQHDTYGEIAADFSTATYDYASMTDKPNGINLATSLLTHHCGVAVDMVYGPKASGMYNHKAAYAMKTYFKYSSTTTYVFRDTCTVSWDSLIVSHLNQKIPLYYAGWSVPDTNGHAFVCDGYQRVDSNYYYHFNFGWDGYMDGYYYTHALTPGGNNFNLAQEIIINAYPDTSLYTYPQKLFTGTQTLTAESGSFEDGSGRLENYANHMDYTWIVQPDLDSIQKIDFYIQYEIAENDTLFILSNDPAMDEYRITNDSGSLELTVLKNQLLVRLVSGSTETKDGFYAYYSTTIPSYCAPLQIITAKSGKISDGSGSKRYNNFTECKKRIKIDNVNYISLHFTKFETEKDKDILYIYDYASVDNDLLLSLSGNIGDTTFVLNTNFLFMVFVTDEQNTYDGWELSYTSGVSAIDELKARSHSLYVFPNPATDQVYIEHSQDIIKEVYVYNLLGKQVKYFNVNNTKTTLSISDLSKGIYFLHIQTNQGVRTKKIVKE